MVIVIFGVSGAGKTTVGRMLAEALGWEFLDADDFHSDASKRKMTSGVPLDDEDRRGWLNVLRALIEEKIDSDTDLVLACSALKSIYRASLQVCDEVEFAYLKGSHETIARRMRDREGHFMNPALLQSQFDTLEEPDSDEWTFSVEDSPEIIVAKVCEQVMGDK